MTGNAFPCGRVLPTTLSRRQMLQSAGVGFGSLALNLLLADEQRVQADQDGILDPRRLTGKAKHVIFLFMNGGPSHVDTFDPKPELARLNGKDVPESIAKGIPRIARSALTNLFASPYRFSPCGKSGLPVSSLLPEIGKQADSLCVLRSCRHNSPIHAPAEYITTTGSQVGDRPSLGAWLTYGLGSEAKDLPAFVVFLAGAKTSEPTSWSSGFLPARYQGVRLTEDGIPNLALPAGTTRQQRRAQLDLLAALNQEHCERHAAESELEARIRSYELAFRMQTAAPEAFDLSRESKETKKLYGLDQKDTEAYGTYCLLARRLVERGVRFILVQAHDWDAHDNLHKNHSDMARQTDRPIAGLLEDLRRTGLLEKTLVVWGGEFGRTPTAEARSAVPGRNHSPSGYSMWLAGGGVKGGQAIGATDPVGYAAVERPIHPNDLHATILHAFGIKQHKLFYRHNNRKELLTVNGAEVIDEVFA